MTLKHIGEFGFIQRFAPKFQHLISKSDFGIGDDCALISESDDDYHLVSTDLLVEGVHFLKDRISPQDLGHKALAVNLSDIAAMGGNALYSFLSIGIPEGIDVDYLDAFMSGYYELSKVYNVALMGGDTTRSEDKLIINIAVVGCCKKSEVHMRSMAQNGDIICTTGTLGDSAAGLKCLFDNPNQNADTEILIKHHHTPQPRLKEGGFLAKQKGVNAMMDISDGIASDLLHILKASNKSAKINLDMIPISSLLSRVAEMNGWNTEVLAAAGGEDYELLFTVEKSQFENIQMAYYQKFGQKIFTIGEIMNGEPQITWYKNSEIVQFDAKGFNHFR